MSVFLHVKMDFDCKEGKFWDTINPMFTREGAMKMAALPTLQWKVYGADPIRRQGSGFYLFKSAEAARNRAEEAVYSLQQRPNIYNVTSQMWEILEDSTRICHGPIDLPMISELPSRD